MARKWGIHHGIPCFGAGNGNQVRCVLNARLSLVNAARRRESGAPVPEAGRRKGRART